MLVLHYIPTLSRADGGTSAYMQQLADALGQLVELHVVTHGSSDELPLRHCVVHRLPASWRLWSVRSEYRRLLDALRPDVVHVNCCWKPAFAYAVLWAREAGYPVVLSPHGMLEPWIVGRHYLSRKLPALYVYQRRALRAADVVHVTSEMERDHILGIASYCPPLADWHPRLQVIGNGIDADGIIPKSSWQRTHRLLFLSRIHPKKGIDLLLRAFAAARSDDALLRDYVLQVAGDGEPSYVASLRTLSRSLGLEDAVVWLGSVYGDTKWSLLREADLLVLPTYSENFGIVVAEALASATPVLTTTGTPWIFVNDAPRCGWCTDATVDALRTALLSFSHADTRELQRMGQRGRSHVASRFSSSVIARQFLELYESLLY